jgi:hypothetical protein
MDPLARAVRLLTVAVWCLCGLVALQIASNSPALVRSLFQITRGGQRGPVTFTGGQASRSVEVSEPFRDLSPEGMIAKSSVILLVSYQPDGQRFKAVVAEILKRQPDVALRYSVGDELRELSYYPNPDVTRGEGQVVFMVGSSAAFRSSFSFDGGRIGGLGDMPLAVLRAMVKKSNG